METQKETQMIVLNGNTQETEKYNYKLTEEQFHTILRENKYIPSRTARAIRQRYNITISRQAVRLRAMKYAEEKRQYKEEILDMVEGAIFDALEQDKDLKLKYRAALYLDKKMGNVDRQNDTPGNNENVL
jgi:hypothetical protein